MKRALFWPGAWQGGAGRRRFSALVQVSRDGGLIDRYDGFK